MGRVVIEELTVQELEALVARALSVAVEPVIGELRRTHGVWAGVCDARALAELLGVSPRTLEKWRRERGLPFVRVGRVPVFMLDDVVAWLRSNDGGGGIQDALAAEQPP